MTVKSAVSDGAVDFDLSQCTSTPQCTTDAQCTDTPQACFEFKCVNNTCIETVDERYLVPYSPYGPFYLGGANLASSVINGQAFFFSTKEFMGICHSYVNFSWPACVTQCVNRICPNKKNLSNVMTYTGHASNGSWQVSTKIEVSSTAIASYCPVY